MLMDKKSILSYLRDQNETINNTDDNAYLEFHTPFEFLEKTEKIVAELIPFSKWDLKSLLKSYTSDVENNKNNSFNLRIKKLMPELKEKIQ